MNMGHYSDAYEHEDNQRRKELKKRYKESGKQAMELRHGLPSNVPTRFKEALEDLENWLEVNGGK